MRGQSRPDSMAVSSSLSSIHISPRTPRTPRVPTLEDGEEDLELTLLGEDERQQAARDLGEQENQEILPDSKRPISARDKRSMVLLCVLCKFLLLVILTFSQVHKDLIQGVPVRSTQITVSKIALIIKPLLISLGLL